MGTTADKFNYLMETKSVIKEAIKSKGVEVAETDTFRTYAEKILEIQSVVEVVYENDVNFRDYNGHILHSYTKDAFLTLQSMPELPIRPGLICQEWNWSLDEAKTYVEKFGILDIGATYITDDGKTRLYVTVSKGYMDIPLQFEINSSYSGVVIEWGDGTSTECNDRKIKTSHHYAETGDYIITIDPKTYSIRFTLPIFNHSQTNNTVYANGLNKIEFGKNILSIDYGVFCYCRALHSVTMPTRDYNYYSIGGDAFKGCISLSCFVVPKGVRDIGSGAFEECVSLETVVFSNFAMSINSSTFADSGLTRLIIPENIENDVATSAFFSCHKLLYVVNPSFEEVIPEGCFHDCELLKQLVFPEGLRIIGRRAFRLCPNLTSVVFPASITLIRDNAFYQCSAVKLYDFSACETIPELINIANEEGYPLDGVSGFEIVVPDALYDEWIAATNWSTYASQIVKASEYNG